MLENIFHLKENHTDVKTEIMAGITTFMTMAYILRSECRMVTVSQRLTRSRSAEYSGCFQSGSKDTFTVGIVAPSGLALM